MEKAMKKFDFVLQIILGIAGIVMILIETYAVFARNVLGVSTPWTDETLKLMFVWVIFCGASLAFLDDSMIAMTLIEDKLADKKKSLGIVKIFQFAVAMILAVVLTQQSLQIVKTQIATGAASAIMKYPSWVNNSGILVGNVLTIVYGIYKLNDCKKYFSNKGKKE